MSEQDDTVVVSNAKARATSEEPTRVVSVGVRRRYSRFVNLARAVPGLSEQFGRSRDAADEIAKTRR